MRTRPRRSGKKSTPFLLAADGEKFGSGRCLPAENWGSGPPQSPQKPPPTSPKGPLQPPPTGGGFRSYFCRGIRRSHLPPVGGNEGGRLPQLGEVGGGRGAESLFHHLLAENEIVADSDAEISGRARANYGSNYTVRILGSAIVCWF